MKSDHAAWVDDVQGSQLQGLRWVHARRPGPPRTAIAAAAAAAVLTAFVLFLCFGAA